MSPALFVQCGSKKKKKRKRARKSKAADAVVQDFKDGGGSVVFSRLFLFLRAAKAHGICSLAAKWISIFCLSTRRGKKTNSDVFCAKKVPAGRICCCASLWQRRRTSCGLRRLNEAADALNPSEAAYKKKNGVGGWGGRRLSPVRAPRYKRDNHREETRRLVRFFFFLLLSGSSAEGRL